MQLKESFKKFFEIISNYFFYIIFVVQVSWDRCSIAKLANEMSFGNILARSYLLSFLFSPYAILFCNITALLYIHIASVLAHLLYLDHTELYPRVKVSVMLLFSIIVPFFIMGGWFIFILVSIHLFLTCIELTNRAAWNIIENKLQIEISKRYEQITTRLKKIFAEKKIRKTE